MDLEKLFKNLIIGNGVLLIVAIIAGINIPEELFEIQLIVESKYQSTQFAMVAGLLTLVAHLVCLVLLYRYVSVGKNLYVIVIIAGTILDLAGGAYVFHAFTLTVISIYSLITGAILTLLFFSPIKDKFIQK